MALCRQLKSCLYVTEIMEICEVWGISGEIFQEFITNGSGGHHYVIFNNDQHKIVIF